MMSELFCTKPRQAEFGRSLFGDVSSGHDNATDLGVIPEVAGGCVEPAVIAVCGREANLRGSRRLEGFGGCSEQVARRPFIVGMDEGEGGRADQRRGR